MEATQATKPSENDVRQALTGAGFHDYVVQTERSANKDS
jgi:hypothetical protein